VSIEHVPSETAESKPVFQRVLLKLSGEALMGEAKSGIDSAVVKSIAAEVKEVHDAGVLAISAREWRRPILSPRVTPSWSATGQLVREKLT